MSIEVLTSVTEAERFAERLRTRGQRLGLVPTMGALHAGHLSLVRRAVAECGAACVSVFVNPLQFDQAGDLKHYPRDFEGDVRLRAAADCDMVFTGELADFFPADAARAKSLGQEFSPAHVQLDDPGPAAEGLEGEHRAGHFAGVATICRRLFEVIEPDRAYFGQKDFQQTLVVQQVAARRGAPQIVVAPTVREPSGLALSSRNTRLRPQDREAAGLLSQALHAAWKAWSEGERDRLALEQVMANRLRGVEVEYAAVRDPEQFAASPARLERGQALVAAQVGPVRLIDNHRLDGPALELGP